AAAGSPAQHRQTDAARDRYLVGHRQRLQLRRNRRPSQSVAPDRARTYQEHLSQARGPYPRRSGVRGGAARPDQAVKDDVAKPLMSGRRRRQATRVLLYLLLQALIAVVCVLVVRMPPPEPSSRYLLTEFNLNQDGVARPV